MSASRRPPPPIPRIDGRKLGPPPRSMFIELAMSTFGMSEADAVRLVDEVAAEHGLKMVDDRKRGGHA